MELALISLAIVLVLVLLSMDVAIALFLVGFFGLWYSNGFGAATMALSIMPYSTVANEVLTVLPLFIMIGSLAYLSGIASQGFDTAVKWLGRLPGGLGVAAIGASALFAATCGSTAATAATIGKISIPEMRKQGYSAGSAVGIAAAGGVLGIMIPPSVPLVVIGIVTGTSVGQLLIAGIGPGVLTAVVYATGVSMIAVFRPHILPKSDRYSWKDKLASLRGVWGIGLLFLVIVGGIFTGLFTPSEAAAVGSGIGLAFLIVRRRRIVEIGRGIRDAIADAVPTTCMIFFILIGATTYGSFIALSGAAEELVKAVLGLGLSPTGLVVAIILMYIPLGMFLDPTSMILITIPLVWPILVGGLGYSPLWVGVLLVSEMELAVITPPLAYNLFILNALFPDISMTKIVAGVFPFIGFHFFVFACLIMWPSIATWLPSLM